ncbi:hypothetical protein Tco_0950757 [Tanacetum coccineum]
MSSSNSNNINKTSGRCNNAETSNVVANNGKGKKIVSDLDQQFTSLDQVDPMLDDIKIKVSLTISRPPSVKKTCIGLNHSSKRASARSTTVTRIEQFNENLFGFKIETFADILTRQYLEIDFIDIPAVHCWPISMDL